MNTARASSWCTSSQTVDAADQHVTPVAAQDSSRGRRFRVREALAQPRLRLLPTPVRRAAALKALPWHVTPAEAAAPSADRTTD